MTTLNCIDAVCVPVTDVDAAAAFYAGVFGATVTNGDTTARIELHGQAGIELEVAEAPLAPGFGRVVITYVLEQPSQVKAVMDAAVAHGARVLKPAKKALFGSFSGSIVSPDGLVWKLAADKGKDTAAPTGDPVPVEVTIILGVREPKESRTFYTDLGMEVDRDYGSKYIDFRPVPGTARLCLMQSPVLAKDVGMTDSSGPAQVSMVHRPRSPLADSPESITDPDGFTWLIEDAG